MPKLISIRALSEEEAQAIEKLARSRTTAKRTMHRAIMIKLCTEELSPRQIGQRLGYEPDSVTCWVKRFNTQGINGLQDETEGGRKANYSQQVRGEDSTGASWTAFQLLEHPVIAGLFA